MASVYTYAFDGIVVSLDTATITGFAEGDNALQIERSKEAFAILVGADGHAMASRSADRSGVATLRLLQGSPSNAFLSAKVDAQEAGILSPLPFAAKDLNGFDLVIAEAAYVVGPPPFIRGERPNAIEWKLALPALKILQGGATQ